MLPTRSQRTHTLAIRMHFVQRGGRTTRGQGEESPRTADTGMSPEHPPGPEHAPSPASTSSRFLPAIRTKTRPRSISASHDSPATPSTLPRTASVQELRSLDRHAQAPGCASRRTHNRHDSRAKRATPPRHPGLYPFLQRSRHQNIRKHLKKCIDTHYLDSVELPQPNNPKQSESVQSPHGRQEETANHAPTPRPGGIYDAPEQSPRLTKPRNAFIPPGNPPRAGGLPSRPALSECPRPVTPRPRSGQATDPGVQRSQRMNVRGQGVHRHRTPGGWGGFRLPSGAAAHSTRAPTHHQGHRDRPKGTSMLPAVDATVPRRSLCLRRRPPAGVGTPGVPLCAMNDEHHEPAAWEAHHRCSTPSAAPGQTGRQTIRQRYRRARPLIPTLQGTARYLSGCRRTTIRQSSLSRLHPRGSHSSL